MPEKQINRTILLVACLMLCIVLSGCRQQAYTEIYAQRMAADMRALEDRIYEFDSEYQLLEQENLSLQAENLRLRAQLGAGERFPTPGTRPNSTPHTSQSPLYMGGLEPATIEPVSPYPSSIPRSESKRVSPTTEKSSSEGKSIELSAPDERSARRQSTREAAGPPSQKPEKSSPGRTPTPARPKSLLPGGVEMDDLKLDVTTPPSNKKQSSNDGSPKTVPRDHLPIAQSENEIAEAHIPMPAIDAMNNVQLASAAGPVDAPAKRDLHVVEIVFHPSLTRGFDQNDDQRDDGIYLVLQPKNASSQFLPEAARITVVAFDPSLAAEQARIGSWQFSKKEIEARIQPIGFSQGIHLPLKWQNNAVPRTDRVAVSITYELEDGRKLVNHREITIGRESTSGSVWTPISNK